MYLPTEIKIIPFEVAAPFIRKWHYSGNTTRGSNVYFGWYLEGQLYAVANYGSGVAPKMAVSLARRSGEPVADSTLMELKRLCRAEPKQDVYLTYFLSKCHKILKKHFSTRYIVSFSDPAQGHDGGIYKAANFKRLGKGDRERGLVDKHGEPYHKLYAQRYAERHNITKAEARKKLGLRMIGLEPKDRWFLCLYKPKLTINNLFQDIDNEYDTL